MFDHSTAGTSDMRFQEAVITDHLTDDADDNADNGGSIWLLACILIPAYAKKS